MTMDAGSRREWMLCRRVRVKQFVAAAVGVLTMVTAVYSRTARTINHDIMPNSRPQPDQPKVLPPPKPRKRRHSQPRCSSISACCCFTAPLLQIYMNIPGRPIYVRRRRALSVLLCCCLLESVPRAASLGAKSNESGSVLTPPSGSRGAGQTWQQGKSEAAARSGRERRQRSV